MENPPPPPEPPQCVIPLHKPSLRELTFFFASGILVSVPFTLFLGQLYPFVPNALAVVVFAPFIEELAKVFPLFYRHGETERSIVTLGILIGLGFGISEFVLYVFVGGVPFFARIPGIVFHASSAGIVAFGIAKKNPLPFYLTAVFLHMVNNYFAVSGEIFGVFVALLVLLIAYYLAWKYYHQASKVKIVT
ncbi:MAG: PrsW family intramembrane metalloprotease [Candidatus Bathyarchaeota archaeon]|nr:PrsW family intramembrane metalloprotease [Candidatus Bathyarchaeota archaeon]